MTTTPLDVAYRCARTLTLNNGEIIAGAQFLEDQNPIHNDPAHAATSRFGGLIACGPHVSGIHACMLPTHCAALGYDVLGTVFTVRYTAPVHANTQHDLTWTITAITQHRSGGDLIDWTGTVTNQTTERVCIEATGQILATSAPLERTERQSSRAPASDVARGTSETAPFEIDFGYHPIGQNHHSKTA